jgi:hypothetical protein
MLALPRASNWSCERANISLQILLGIMGGAFGLAGYYFGSKPTSATSESKVAIAHQSAPWQQAGKSGDEDFKYKYHPGGDVRNAPKEAPSALHSVIVPNVNLPKVCSTLGEAIRGLRYLETSERNSDGGIGDVMRMICANTY